MTLPVGWRTVVTGSWNLMSQQIWAPLLVPRDNQHSWWCTSKLVIRPDTTMTRFTKIRSNKFRKLCNIHQGWSSSMTVYKQVDKSVWLPSKSSLCKSLKLSYTPLPPCCWSELVSWYGNEKMGRKQAALGWCCGYGCDGASQYPHPSDADFMFKIRRIQMWICCAIKIISYFI